MIPFLIYKLFVATYREHPSTIHQSFMIFPNEYFKVSLNSTLKLVKNRINKFSAPLSFVKHNH